MYFSKNMRDALLMTRINNNYYNYTIPALNLEDYIERYHEWLLERWQDRDLRNDTEG